MEKNRLYQKRMKIKPIEIKMYYSDDESKDTIETNCGIYEDNSPNKTINFQINKCNF